MGRPILYVAGRDPHEEVSGGHSAYVRVHGLAARRAGYEPHVFCVSGCRGSVETPYGVLHRLRSEVWPRRQVAVMAHGPRLAREVVRFARRLPGPHVVHGFAVWSWAAVRAARALAARGIAATALASSYTTYAAESRSKSRGVAGVHGAAQRLRFAAEYAWIRLALGRYERDGYEGARAVLGNYESVRRLLREAGLRVGRAWRKVPYTAASAFLGPPAGDPGPAPAAIEALEPRDAPLVVCLSRHEPRKGVHVLLDAFAVLAARGVRFRAVLLGAGPLLAAHVRRASALQLGSAVAITGPVEDPEPFLRRADVYVLPSLAEQSGSLALIEALRLGRPAVVSACDGLLEDLVGERDALFAAPGDAAALAAALGRALTDAPLRARLSARAREVFRERFAPEVLAAALRGIYEPLLAPAP